MSNKKKKMAENQESTPKAVVAEKYKVVGVEPGLVHWGNDDAKPRIPWKDWDLSTITDAEKKLLFDNGFPYLEKE